MKNTLFLLLFFTFNSLYSELEYRKATLEDVPNILKLINKHAIHDSDKIVILPKKFREAVIKDSVVQGRIFVAVYHYIKCCCIPASKIVGYKKLYLLTAHDEKQNILFNEIRCKELANIEASFIYSGSDFTHPRFRAQGINKALTTTAFNCISKELAKKTNTNIALLFGLTDANDCRKQSIEDAFKAFLDDLGEFEPIVTLKNKAFMPTFDPESQECRPLDDAQSKSGNGYALVAQGVKNEK